LQKTASTSTAYRTSQLMHETVLSGARELVFFPYPEISQRLSGGDCWQIYVSFNKVEFEYLPTDTHNVSRLASFISSKDNVKGKKLITVVGACDAENIKSIIELIINKDKFSFTPKEKKQLKKASAIFKFFRKKRNLKSLKIKNYLRTNSKILKLFLSIILPKAYELFLECMYAE
jgi:hypothetical protein